jgi:hypothetical protein
MSYIELATGLCIFVNFPFTTEKRPPKKADDKDNRIPVMYSVSMLKMTYKPKMAKIPKKTSYQ